MKRGPVPGRWSREKLPILDVTPWGSTLVLSTQDCPSMPRRRTILDLGEESQREREVGRERRDEGGEALIRENQSTNIIGYVSAGLISPAKTHSFDLCFPGT